MSRNPRGVWGRPQGALASPDVLGPSYHGSQVQGLLFPPFKVHRGVTHGDPLYPTIFSVDVDAAIRHFLMVVAATEAGAEGLSVAIQDLVAYFYSDNGLVA